MRFLTHGVRPLATSALAALLLAQPASGQQPLPRAQRPGRVATPTAVSPASAPLPAPAPMSAAAAKAARDYDPQRLLAGHLLRRIGFGPTPKEVDNVLKVGMTTYIEQQLDPAKIDDSAAEARLPKGSNNLYNDYKWITRWYTRMVVSRRQLQEKMTLIWHEHFATSNAKVGTGFFMHEQEELLRKDALGSFRQLLVDVSTDKAMLIWLDNDDNSATEEDDDGNPIPPNENYARELMQLFSLGTTRLNMDGTPVLDGRGLPVPNYTEDDVKAVARAISGFYVDYRTRKTVFLPYQHDSSDKVILGETLHGRSGQDGAHEVDDVIGIIMRQPSVAPFISKELIEKLATETPTPGYVERVATVFKTTDGDLKATVRAILTDSEFTSDAVVRSQFKEPIEHFVGPIRALDGKTKGAAFIPFCIAAKQLIYYPPSVFSFYRPGQKGSLVNTALATIRDSIADAIVTGFYDTSFDAVKLIRKNRLTTPEQTVDYLSDVLLAAPLDPQVRERIVQYMDGRVDEEKFRGAVWLVLVSPDFQRN